MLRKNKFAVLTMIIYSCTLIFSEQCPTCVGLVPKVLVPLLDTLQSLPQFTFLYVHFYLYTHAHWEFSTIWKAEKWELGFYLHLKKLLLIPNILVRLKNNFSMFFAHFSYWYSSFLLVYTSPQYMKTLSYVKVFFPLNCCLSFKLTIILP